VQVDVYSEEALTGMRRLTSRAYLTFVAIDENGSRVPVPPLLLESDEERRVCDEAHVRRAERLRKKTRLGSGELANPL
jgi:acyl-CoA hydrolase